VLVFLLRGRDLPPTLVTNRVLLFVLWYIDAVLILAIVFVLARNLVKLLVERHNRILGSKFKTKLVFTYIGLSLVPGLLLFFYASGLLSTSIERWFAAPGRQVLEQGYSVARAMDRMIEDSGMRAARRVARELEGIDLRDSASRPRLVRRMAELRVEMGLDLVALYDGGDFVHAVIDPQAGLPDLPEPGSGMLQEAERNGEAVRRPQDMRGQLVLTAARGPSERVPGTVVVVGTLLDRELAAQSAELIQAYQNFRQLEVQKGQLKASHFLTFLMVTLLILLAASWTGLYLARRITVPIQALADGTRRISQGDLGHRVDVEADDELGVLVESFNRMTSELERNRGLLERSNRELRDANRTLAEERSLIAAVLENVAAGVVSIDAQGRIFVCNGAALQMLGQQEAEVLGKTPREAWSDPERGRLAELVEQAPAAERGRHELRLVAGGEWRTFDVKVTPMQGAGAAAGVVVVLEDLTELIKAQQLATWSEAARRVAHEIKNPLTPIRLAAERMLRKQEDGDADAAASVSEGVEIIVREVETMKRMVDEFSRFARMPRPQPSAVDLAQLVNETLHLYRGVKPGVAVEGDLRDGAATAHLDAEQIKRALINLLDNAVEATPAPGRVEVVVERRDGRLEIRVGDSGPGIPAEARDKIFLPYFSTKGRGSGLGLAIVHRIVIDHHGTLRVEDNPGGGSVFTITLPLA
jgi:two-component system nitrogen regulation sensor histidine kinase NtrY